MKLLACFQVTKCTTDQQNHISERKKKRNLNYYKFYSVTLSPYDKVIPQSEKKKERDVTYPAHGAETLVNPLVPVTGSHILISGWQGLVAPVEVWSIEWQRVQSYLSDTVFLLKTSSSNISENKRQSVPAWQCPVQATVGSNHGFQCCTLYFKTSNL